MSDNLCIKTLNSYTKWIFCIIFSNVLSFHFHNEITLISLILKKHITLWNNNKFNKSEGNISMCEFFIFGSETECECEQGIFILSYGI